MASVARGVAVVGCGNIGVSRHIPAWMERPHGFYLAAVADPDATRREAGRVAGNLELRDAVSDLGQLLQRPDIGVVDLCVPPGLRPALVEAAAHAGKHVLSEKPLALTPAEATAMVDACRAAGVVLGVVHNYLFFPEIVRARSLVDSGAVGDIEVVILNYLGASDNPGAAEYRPRWRHDPRAGGGGVLMDLIHVVYLAEAVLGGRIEAASGFVTARTDGGVEDLALCRFERRDAVALANVGWGVGPGGIDVSGSTGRLSIRYRDGGTSPFAPFEQLELTDADGTRLIEVPAGDGFLAPAIADFACAVATGGRPAADGEDALHVLEAALAVYKSAATGATIRLPLEPSDPVFRGGVAGLASLALDARGPVARRALFGASAARSAEAPVP